MTRLNLTETCLLEVSGELGAKAHEQLREHIAGFPAAKLEYELIKGQFELLRQAPHVAMTDDQKRRIASLIKQGVHRKLRQKDRQAQSEERWKFIYKALAGISAAAACIVVGGTIYTVNAAIERQNRANQIAALNSKIEVLVNYDRENDTDRAIHDVADGITALQDGSPALSSAQTKEMTSLLDALADVPEHPGPTTPGSL